MSTANTAQSTANTASSNASTALSTANSKLSKSASDTLTGPITLSASNAITVGTPALDGVSGKNGFYIGSTGIVGTKNGVATMTISNSGDATFAGVLTVGSSPEVSSSTMTGAGAKINSGGTFALGNSSTNITYNGTAMYLNGNVIATANINANAVTNSTSAYTSASISAINSSTWRTVQSLSITTSGGTVYVASSGSQVQGEWYSGDGGGGGIIPIFRILFDGSVIIEGGSNPAMSYSGIPSAGTHSLELQIRALDSGSGSVVSYGAVTNRSLFAMEMKR